MEYIFVCYAGVNRSPVAVDVSRSLARKYNVKDFNADFLGIANVNSSNLASFREKLDEVDIVFALDSEVTRDLIGAGVDSDKICNLDISDIYPVREYPQLRDELERILTLKLEPFFSRD